MSAIGLGCWAFGGHGYGAVDDRQSIATIRSALDRGITLFDTADIYGPEKSERVLSEGLGDDRHRVVIATKFGVAWDEAGRTRKDINPARVRSALEASLRRLRVECIPLYQVHWPDGVHPLDDVLAVLAQCRDEGKIEYIGVTNFSASEIAAAKSDLIASSQYSFSVADRDCEPEMTTCVRDLGIGTLAYGVLVRGLLTGKFDRDVKFEDRDTRATDVVFQAVRDRRASASAHQLPEIARRYGKTEAQVAIRWALQHPSLSCAIVGSRTPSQLEENAAAADWILTGEDWRVLEQAGA